jgi:hypothetical protein
MRLLVTHKAVTHRAERPDTRARRQSRGQHSDPHAWRIWRCLLWLYESFMSEMRELGVRGSALTSLARRLHFK